MVGISEKRTCAQELHTCSDYAPYVHPYAALELQNLFDAGVGLVDQMDGGAWQQLAAMRAGEAVDLVNEVGHAIQDPKQTIRNVNAFFTAAAKKRAPDILQRAQALDAAISAGGDEYPSPPRRMGARHPDPLARLSAVQARRVL